MKKNAHSSKYNSAFTLIELLSVIAIIAILAAILIPTIQGVRDRAQEAARASSYRHFYIANTLYAQDNNGYTTQAKDGTLLWMSRLEPYSEADYKNDESGLFYDPFFDKTTLAGNSSTDETVTGVGLNIKIGMPDDGTENVTWYAGYPWGGKYKLDQITETSTRILLGDSIQWFLNDSTVDTTRHDDGSTGIFVRFDGSIARYTAEEAQLGIMDPTQLPLKSGTE
jgi:prepilin-type N-terminal cleavage/methylation domain-containing protein